MKKMCLTFTLPYFIFAILFMLFQAKVIAVEYMQPNIYWQIIAVGNMLCGVLLFCFVVLLMKIEASEFIILLLHVINLIILLLLVKRTMMRELPFYNQYSFTFLIIGIEIVDSIRLLRKIKNRNKK